jgi:hypothetical protein
VAPKKSTSVSFSISITLKKSNKVIFTRAICPQPKRYSVWGGTSCYQWHEVGLYRITVHAGHMGKQ